jgi:hypothetical protein
MLLELRPPASYCECGARHGTATAIFSVSFHDQHLSWRIKSSSRVAVAPDQPSVLDFREVEEQVTHY